LYNNVYHSHLTYWLLSKRCQITPPSISSSHKTALPSIIRSNHTTSIRPHRPPPPASDISPVRIHSFPFQIRQHSHICFTLLFVYVQTAKLRNVLKMNPPHTYGTIF